MSLPGIAPHDHHPQFDPALVADHDADATRQPSPAHSTSSASNHPNSLRARKNRKDKARIELAPDQPLTTQGRPRARVYVACVQCRTRKIRCDGAKPTCHNCTRRAKPAEEVVCVYDAAPKRRGPDKTPGARQRTSREAHQKNNPDESAPRRRRRKRHTSTPPPPQPQPLSFSVPAYSPVPPKQPSIILDPQLVDMPPFHPTSAPAATMYTLTPSGSTIPDRPSLRGPSHHMTRSQVLP